MMPYSVIGVERVKKIRVVDDSLLSLKSFKQLVVPLTILTALRSSGQHYQLQGIYIINSLLRVETEVN